MGKKLKWNLIVMSVLYLALGIFLLMVPGWPAVLRWEWPYFGGLYIRVQC